VDLGKVRDHTAVVVVEQQVAYLGHRDPITYVPVMERRMGVVHCEQVALGTKYCAVAEYLQALCAYLQGLGAKLVEMSVDATGLGSVVVEQIENGLARGVECRSVVFTGGERSRGYQRVACIPKVELMMGLMRLLELQEVCVAPGVEEWARVEAELVGMRRRMGAGMVQFSTESRHDDLVMALALAVDGAWLRQLPVRWEGVRRLAGF
jgi:hypothetical protein